MTLPAFNIDVDEVFDNVTTDTLNTDTINPTTAGGSITFGGDVGAIVLNKGTVTQATNINTTVTLNEGAGVITTQTATTAADGNDSFQVNNSLVTTSSIVTAQIQNYSVAYTANGLPTVNVQGIAAGQFDIVISNPGLSALNGVLQISFIVS